MKRASAIVLFLSVVLMVGGVAVASALEPLTLPDLNGGMFKIDYASSRITLVNFWAVWCMPCREEMPEISKLVETYGARGLSAVGITMESGEAADVKRFLEDHREINVSYPILLGDEKTPARFGGVEAVPTTFLIDAGGQVVRRFIGVNPDFGAKVGAEIEKNLAPTGKP